jgi:hypothetical protein
MRIPGPAGLLLLAGAMLGSSCASAPGPAPNRAAGPGAGMARASTVSTAPRSVYRPPEARRQQLTDDESRVLASAKTLIGKPPNARVVVNGRTFILDCIGTVSAIFYRLDIDVTRDFARFPGNGVNRLYLSLKEKNVLHRDSYPRPGDVIFWDNTYDANNDGDFTNDPRTHAGIVLSVDDDGTIHYVHEHIRRGVIVETMNLLHPADNKDGNGKQINSFLALVSGLPADKRPERLLAGEIWNSFGDVLKQKDHYRTAAGGQENLDADPTMLAQVEFAEVALEAD